MPTDLILEIAKIVGSLLIGGFIGFTIGVNKSIKQTKKGGDNATVIQAGTVNNNTFVGITEQRAREIFSSEMACRMRDLAVPHCAGAVPGMESALAFSTVSW